MYFKKLELQGFKSFATRTEFVFEPGVTAIVGPNGTGKSNIVDGIKWVLGVQSAKSLRGLKMEDVIFNGTVDKEPVNLAEVTLTLSNHSKMLPIDYDEVTIGRRLYRSGESEYVLNKTVVRLKDISELLAGTGIGVDNYFLMEQGKIDLILSSKPEERRAIFEEASGITKYKAKKREAMLKLEHTEANLLRINDIILEVERQIRSIERQAQKARRYQKHFDRLKDLEVRLSSIEFEGLKNKYDELQQGIKNSKGAEEKSALDSRAAQEQLRQLRQDMESVDENIALVKSEIVNVESAIFKNNQRAQLDKERIESLTQGITELNERITSSGAKAEGLKKQSDELQLQKEELFKDKDQKEKTLLENEEKFSSITTLIKDADSAIKQGKLDLLEKTNQHIKAKNGLIKLGTDIATKQSRLKRLGAEKENTNVELERVKEDFAKTGQDCDNKAQELSLINEKLNSLRVEIEGVKERIVSTQKASSSAQEEYAVLQSRLEILEQLVATHEGFPEAVKNLLDESNRDRAWYPGICGVFADLVSVREGYEQCIEAALENDAESIAVKDKQAAEQIGAYLKENQAGKARMLVLPQGGGQQQSNGIFSKLNFIKPKEQAQISHPDILGRALDFVSVAGEYQALIEELLASVWIAKDLPSAVRVLDGNKGIKIVTLEGEIVEQGCIIAGKSNTEEPLGLIGRETKLARIKQQIKKLEDTISALKQDMEGFSQRKRQLEEELTPQEELARQEEIGLANLQSRKNSVGSEKARLEDESNLLALEYEEIEEELKELKEREAEYSTQVEGLQQAIEGLESLISENQGLIDRKSAEKEELAVLIATLKTEFSTLSDREKSILGSLRVVMEAFNAEENIVTSSKAQITDSQAKIETLKDQIVQAEQDTRELSGKKESLAFNSEGILSQRKDMAVLIDSKQNEQESLQKRLQDIKSEIYSLDVKSTELTYEQQRLKDKISQTYKIELESYTLLVQKDSEQPAQEPAADFNAEEARVEIEDLRRKLDSIGNVNLAAMDEQKELEERYNFLVTQREDLVKAKDALHSAITKINRTTKTMFVETFEKIKAEFRNFFKAMFGGGEAELFLVDTTDVLESGIEIAVRPPGKKLQNISLLSGGEKSMTALALLFAVFKIKPSPFCIMDEMDAALDEANVDRFTRVLQDFTRHSQFIIITHNKKTITKSDVMYGITMQQSGISKVVSAKFAEKKEEEAMVAA